MDVNTQHNSLQPVRNTSDVGIIVGRFQVGILHQGHIDLIQTVIDENARVIIFLGLSPLKTSFNNPLDFEARKQLVLEKFPDITVVYINDCVSDEIWSSVLDRQIKSLTGPSDEVLLYGSRDAFISHYSGKYECVELHQDVYLSGTAIRKKIGKRVKSDAAFREGVIWATHNRYKNPHPTVDIAIFNSNGDELLVAKKPNEEKFRLIGGFVDTDETYEQAAVREVSEEASGIEIGGISGLTYLGSHVIDDWRFRNELENVVTTLFKATHVFGRPIPADDIEELHWIPMERLTDKPIGNLIVPEHIALLEKVVEDYKATSDKEIN